MTVHVARVRGPRGKGLRSKAAKARKQNYNPSTRRRRDLVDAR